MLNGKFRVTITYGAGVVLVLFIAASAVSADYELGWSTIDGGGGTSSGGRYVLTGTIGQPDAAYSSGDDYELLGGFWPGGPLCIIEFDDFARFAEWWLRSGSDLAGDFDGNGVVDSQDLSSFADYWLSCCPSDWPLR